MGVARGTVLNDSEGRYNRDEVDLLAMPDSGSDVKQKGPTVDISSKTRLTLD
jgi:hypothetical protein